jgi:hypothetical protein
MSMSSNVIHHCENRSLVFSKAMLFISTISHRAETNFENVQGRVHCYIINDPQSISEKKKFGMNKFTSNMIFNSLIYKFVKIVCACTCTDNLITCS